MFWGHKSEITRESMYPAHAHDMNELVVCHSAAGVHLVGREQIQFHPGRIFLLPRGVPHQVKANPGETVVIGFICFDRASVVEHLSLSAQKVLSRLVEDRRHISGIDEGLCQENMRLSDRLQEELSCLRPMGQQVAGSLLGHLILNHARSLGMAPSDGEEAAAKISRICRMVVAEPARERGLDEVARLSGMSRSSFTKNFRRFAGLSFVEFVKLARIQAATRSLAETRLDISEVAAACGFSNLSYFYRTFKNRTGRTPREYREMTGKGGRPVAVLKEEWSEAEAPKPKL